MQGTLPAIHIKIGPEPRRKAGDAAKKHNAINISSHTANDSLK